MYQGPATGVPTPGSWQTPNPFAPKRKLDFVDGESGMRSFYVGPGEVVALFDMGSPTLWLKSANDAGVPSTVTYDLVERDQSVHMPDEDARIAELERQLAEIREAMSRDTVPDVRTSGQPRHVGSPTGQAGGGSGWQPGGGSSVADEVESTVRAAGGQPLS